MIQYLNIKLFNINLLKFLKKKYIYFFIRKYKNIAQFYFLIN